MSYENSPLPFLPKPLCKVIYNFGLAAVQDDIHDVGFLSYTNRPGLAPHPSNLHHYIPGLIMMTFGTIGGIMSQIMEIMRDLSLGFQNEFDENEAISLEDYKKGMGIIPKAQPALPHKSMAVPGPPSI